MPKISIIVPVYCAESYLERCVESILSQTEKNLELILVDDGSIDNTGKMCDDFARKDARVVVIHQENSGVSIARNKGLAIARGEYIGFVDSDDWIEKNMYERLLKTVKKTDAEIVVCDALTVQSNTEKILDTIPPLLQNTTLKKEEINSETLLYLAGAVWRCVYKKDLIKINSIEFPAGIKMSEDRIFNILCMGYAKKIAYLKESYYNRFINLESVVHSFHADYFKLVKDAYYSTQVALDIAWNENIELKNAYLGQFIGGAFAAINNYFYKTCPWSFSEKLCSVKEICDDVELREAIVRSKNNSKRAKWILNKNVFLLSMYSILANIKHRR